MTGAVTASPAACTARPNARTGAADAFNGLPRETNGRTMGSTIVPDALT
ncbi:MAG: hypothetical protein H0X64_14530 [Gemmatimonadaceae bacterium]|nr:hypothetical protein [Gemmatimonadaceae bacterium]